MLGEYDTGVLKPFLLQWPRKKPASMETPLEEGESDKIGGKALDNGRRNEQVVKAKWRRSSAEEKEDDGRKVTRLETDILFLKHACSILRQSSNTCMWFMEEPSQSSVGQTAQSRICSVTEKPHIGHRVG